VPIGAVAVLAAAAMVPLAREVMTGPLGTQRGFDALALPYTALAFIGGFGIGPPVAALHWSRTFGVLLPHALEIGAAAAVGMALAVLVVRSVPGAPRAWTVYLAAWLLVPALSLALRSAVSGTAHNVRYVLGSLPAFVLLAAFALRRHERGVAGVVVALWLGLGALSVYRDRVDPRYAREDVRAAGAYLRTHVNPGDRIVVTTEYQRRTLRHYLRSEREIEKLPVLLVETTADVRTAMTPWLHGGRRTWVVFTREWDEDPFHHLRNALDAEPLAGRAAAFEGVTIRLLEPLVYGICLSPDAAPAGERRYASEP
jgi:hypothetical protein